ncbi:MAG TPA: aminotransferase class I/II-fold pyridoxal phosphate-dependent enzyme [Polyangiales bacterium]|nr:aminotransferase class I/II-fold pyridoxal phosphate-dependent enzyme [Polyangiales bacterium]
MFVVNPVEFGDDLIFALSREVSAKRADGQSCVDATLGVLVDDSGSLLVLPTVAAAVRDTKPAEWAAYASTTGLDSFCEAVINDCLALRPQLRERAVAVATPGATGAIRTALAVFLDRDQAYLSSSLCWSTYPIIAQATQRKLVTFSMFRAADLSFDVAAFERALAQLIDAQGRALVVLNDPCHNPSGYSMSAADWAATARVLRDASARAPVTVLLDGVYSAFMPEGLEIALSALEPLADQLLLAIAWSASKAFTSYGMRAGALIVITPNGAERTRIRDTIACQCCGTWANCNRGALVAITKLLSDPVAREGVARERAEVTALLDRRATLFSRLADLAGLSRPAYRGGFFTSVFVPDARAVAARLRSEGVYVVPMAGALRIALSALTTSDIPHLVDRLAAAIQAITPRSLRRLSMNDNATGLQFAPEHVRKNYSQRLPESVEIIDCTLRDGEQAAGVWFTVEEKVSLARMLDQAGMAVLDAGFPAASDADVEVLQELRNAGLRTKIGATSRALPSDVAACERAHAQEVFMFLATSDIRLRSLGMTRAQVQKQLRAGAEEVLARGMTLNLIAEDAYRTDAGFLIELINGLRDVPIRRFVLADTVGAAFPQAIEHLFSTVHDAIDRSVALCMHCHNDFGMAVANTLAGVLGGARAVTCTVNGIGERAGNADLAEVVAALTHVFGIEHGINPAYLTITSEEVERMSGIHMSALKPVTGFNVYSHESGVHVHGMLKDPRTYEFLPAAWTGRRSRIVLGKHSGVSSIAHVLRERGMPVGDDGQLQNLLERVKHRSGTRSKDLHAESHVAAMELRDTLLAGVEPEVVVQNEVVNSMVVPRDVAREQPRGRVAEGGE